jgi:hypothetical protein
MAIFDRTRLWLAIGASAVAGLGAPVAAQQPDVPPPAAPAWLAWFAAPSWALFATAAAAVAFAAAGVLSALLIAEKKRGNVLRETIRSVQNEVREVTGWELSELEQIPGQLSQLRRDVETVLARVDASETNAPDKAQPRALQAGAQGAVAAAAVFAESLLELVARAQTGSLVNRLDGELNLAANLQATLQALRQAAVKDDAARALADMLRAGELNHVMTTSPLLQAYFGDDDTAIGLRASYQACAALIELALAHAKMIVILVPPLTTVAHGQPVGFDDQRGLRQIKEVHDRVMREARSVHDGDHLVVDCLTPGWRIGTQLKQPRIVAFDRGAWTTAWRT